MTGEIQTLSIVRAVVEMAEDRATLLERVLRVEAANVELQRELEALRCTQNASVVAGAAQPH